MKQSKENPIKHLLDNYSELFVMALIFIMFFYVVMVGIDQLSEKQETTICLNQFYSYLEVYYGALDMKQLCTTDNCAEYFDNKLNYYGENLANMKCLPNSK